MRWVLAPSITHDLCSNLANTTHREEESVDTLPSSLSSTLFPAALFLLLPPSLHLSSSHSVSVFHLLLRLPLTDIRSHLQTLQTSSFSKRSLKRAPEKPWVSHQIRGFLPSVSWPVRCSVFFQLKPKYFHPSYSFYLSPCLLGLSALSHPSQLFILFTLLFTLPFLLSLYPSLLSRSQAIQDICNKCFLFSFSSHRFPLLTQESESRTL